jgi:hypothetical protein
MNPNTAHRVRLTVSAIAAMALGAAALPAQAGRTAIDFGFNSNNGQNFPFTAANSTDCNTGSSVAASCMINLAGDLSSPAINLGFNITVGTQTYGSLFINENGSVSFGAGISGAFASTTDLATLVTGPVTGVIAPFYADLASNATAVSGPTDTSNIQGSILYARGTADIVGPYPDVQSAATTPAFYAAWVGSTLPDQTPIYTQMLLYSLGSGNFDIAFRYGQNDGDTYTAGTGLAGFDFGTAVNTTTIAGDLAANTDYLFAFTGGQLGGTGGSSGGGGGGTTSVPEPSALTLIAVSLAGLWFTRRRPTIRARAR